MSVYKRHETLGNRGMTEVISARRKFGKKVGGRERRDRLG